jgi:CRISPR-associated protein Csh1
MVVLVIEAVSRIGDYVQRNSGGEDLLSTFIENPNSNGKYKFVLIIVLTENNGEYAFSRVEMEEFNAFQKYLYKKYHQKVQMLHRPAGSQKM